MCKGVSMKGGAGAMKHVAEADPLGGLLVRGSVVAVVRFALVIRRGGLARRFMSQHTVSTTDRFAHRIESSSWGYIRT